MSSMQWLVKSDVAAGIAGAIFKSAFPSVQGGMGMVAGRSVLISIIARLVAQSTSLPLGSLSSAQKNEIVVAALGALSSYYHHHGSSLQGAVGAVGIDLIGDSILTVFNMSDGELLATAASAPSRP